MSTTWGGTLVLIPHRTLDTSYRKVYPHDMVIKPLDIRTVRNLPTLRRVLQAYELGMRAEDIADQEDTRLQQVYHWLKKARELRQEGRLWDTQEVQQHD